MIALQDLKGLDEEDVVNLLLDEKQQPFEIHIPKATFADGSPPRNIADDYAFFAYSGYLLEKVSESFDYTFIAPDHYQSIPFRLTSNDLHALAETLLFISTNDINDPPEDKPYFFYDCTGNYLTAAREGEAKAACPDFIKIYDEFIEEANKERERGEVE